MQDAKKSSVLHGKYEVGRLLGIGNFAKVYQSKNILTGELVAMKVVSKEKLIQAGMTEQLKREICVMKMVNHPNIVKIHEVMASKTKIYIAMEYIRGGELFAKISRGRLREEMARTYFQQLISAVDFCHSRGVYHRDLKPENLLLDEKGNLKVSDFGLSALSDHLKKDGLFHTTCGTPAYVAPEVIGKKGYEGAKADLWSCGVILFVLLAGYLPFHDTNIMAMYKKIYRGDFKCPSWFSSDARKILKRLLDPNPITRITSSELMQTIWFKRKSGVMQSSDELAKEIDNADQNSNNYVKTMNAFHIISLSEGFDLSPLFEEKKRKDDNGGRFGTLMPASSVISRLEEVAKATQFSVKKSESRVRLQGMECGRKGKLAVAAEMFAVTPAFMVVEVRKDGGDTLEYDQFWSKNLRPALGDIIWNGERSMAIDSLNK